MIHEGWTQLPPEPPMRPTYWPAVMAIAVAALLWGLISSVLISGAGVILMGLATAGWIMELRHGHGNHTSN